MPLQFVAQGPMLIPAVGGGPFSGPGDVKSGAVGWWGLRAYSIAKAATAPYSGISVTDTSGANLTNINILSTGALDEAALNTFIVANGTACVKTIWDQIGANHLDISVVAQAPRIQQSAIGSHSAIIFTSGGSVKNISSSNITQAQPFTWSVAAKNNTNKGAQAFMISGTAADYMLYNSGPAANVVSIFAGGTAIDVTATDANFHSLQGVYNGASSDFNVDGTSHTGIDIGSNAYSAQFVTLGAFSGAGANPWSDGLLLELGLWGSAFSSGDSSAMNINQRGYWGY